MNRSQSNSIYSTNRYISATVAVLPLSISVIPWGILCGTLSIEAGLTSIQAQLMSLIVFAGATQISGIAVLGGGGSWLTLFNSTLMISIRHTLYSATYKEHIIPLPFYKRLLFAFLLTDEMFVIAQANQLKTGKFDYGYAITAGLVFYLVWNIATLVGIVSAHLLGDIESLGFDFAIAATFIAMVVPMLKHKEKRIDKVLAVAVTITAIASFTFEYWNISNGLIFSALIGMVTGALFSLYDENSSIKNDSQSSNNYQENNDQKNNDNKVIKDSIDHSEESK